MAGEVTDQQLIDAGTDATNFALILNGPATGAGSTVPTRTGPTVPTVANAISTVAATVPTHFRGAYSSATTYNVGDYVTSAGSQYISLIANNLNNALTNNAAWGLAAAAGAPGSTNQLVYSTTTAGLASAASGTSFMIPSIAIAGYYDVYLNNAGAAQYLTTLSSTQQIAGLLASSLQSLIGGNSFGNSSLTTNANTSTSIFTFFQQNALGASGPILSISIPLAATTAGQTIDVVIGTPNSSTPSSIAISSRVTITLPTAAAGIQTFLAGKDFPGLLLASNQVLGVVVKGSAANGAVLTYNLSGNSYFLNSNIGDQAAHIYNTFTGTIAIGITIAKTIPSNFNFANVATLQNVATQVAQGVGTFVIGSVNTAITTFTTTPNIYFQNSAYNAGTIESVQIPISFSPAGGTLTLLVGQPSFTGSTTVTIVQRIAIVVPQVVAVSGQATIVTFSAGLDFTSFSIGQGQLLGILPGTAKTGIGTGTGTLTLSADPGNVAAAYNTFAATLYISANVLNTTPSNFNFANANLVGIPYSGRKWINFGDSYSTQFNNIWQNLVSSRLGMPLFAQYAGPGRTLSLTAAQTNNIFSAFITSGVFSPSALATALMGVDLITIELGTNDAHAVQVGYPLGTIADSGTAATFYGDVAFALDTMQTAAPTAKIVWIGPLHVERVVGQALPTGDYDNWYLDATAELIIEAIQQQCNARGIPLVDMGHMAGFNKINIANADGSPLLMRDHLHPSDIGFTGYWAPIVANALRRFSY